MNKNIKREKIDEDLFLVLKTIFHYERVIETRYGLNFDEIYALQFMKRNPKARVTDLSDELKLPMFTVSRLVNRLHQEGYLSKEKDSIDKRNIYLRLEKTGSEILNEIEQSSYERIMGNVSKMTDEEINAMLRMAEGLHMILGVSENVIRKA